MANRLGIAPRLLSMWHQALLRSCEAPDDCISSLTIRASSRMGLVLAVDWALRRAFSESIDTNLTSGWRPPPDLIPDLMEFVADGIDSFLSLRRTYQMGDPTSSFTSGVGVEQGTFDQMNSRMLACKNYWASRETHFYPLFNETPIEDPERLLQWKVNGLLCGLFMNYFGRTPPSVCPLLILAVIGGHDKFRNLTSNDVLALDPSVYQLLKPWLVLDPDAPTIPTKVAGDLDTLWMGLTGKSVRLVLLSSIFSTLTIHRQVIPALQSRTNRYDHGSLTLHIVGHAVFGMSIFWECPEFHAFRDGFNMKPSITLPQPFSAVSIVSMRIVFLAHAPTRCASLGTMIRSLS